MKKSNAWLYVDRVTGRAWRYPAPSAEDTHMLPQAPLTVALEAISQEFGGPVEVHYGNMPLLLVSSVK
jgi:hypothetical protein